MKCCTAPSLAELIQRAGDAVLLFNLSGHLTPPKNLNRFTTIASWRGAFGPVTHAGKTYGLKGHEFRKLFALPARVKPVCEVALQIYPADKKDLDALLAHGWRGIEPQAVARDCDLFRRYVQNSAAEFSPAQGVYVDTNSGWFSDRTVRYLASGRPVLVQETGFSQHLPVGEGLLAFRNLDEAVEGAEKISRDHEAHCRTARKIAVEFMDTDWAGLNENEDHPSQLTFAPRFPASGPSARGRGG